MTFVLLVVVVARALLSLTFALSGAAKLADLAGSRKAIADFGVPMWLAYPIGSFLPAGEIAVSALLLPVSSVWWGAAAALVLLLTFTAAIAINLMLGRKPHCRCFGQLHSAPIGWPTLTRNAVLIACAGLIVWHGGREQVSFVGWLAALTPSQAIVLIVTAVVFAALAVQTWFIFHLFAQHGRVMLRMDELEQRLNAGPMPASNAPAPLQGLPIGAPAPSFDLRSLSGNTVSLDALREDGKPVLLIFSDPNCSACIALMPEISRWQREYADKVRIAVVSEGTEKANRAKVKRHEPKDFLLQRDQEVAEAYQVNGTPSAMLIRSDGSIGSRLAMGSQAITDLVGRASGKLLPLAGPHAHNGHVGHHVIPAAGLPIGETAPEFNLPDVSGRTVALSDFRGQKVLLLFWSPSCGFCQAMLPDLQAWEDNRPRNAPELVVLSTGGPAANQKLGLRSPVLLDAASAVARQFRGGATPSAVLIDVEGRITSELAVGAPRVLALAGITKAKAVRRSHIDSVGYRA